MAQVDTITELQNPRYIKPILINYTQNGVQKKWEAIISHNSVSILLYHKDKDAFLIVKQLRPPVLNATKDDGEMYELCAGIIDKEQLSDKEIAREEIIEECGYDVPLNNIKEISTFFTSVGISGARQTLYFAKIDESMKVSEGGGLEEEEIELIFIPLSEAKSFMFDKTYKKTPGLMMAFYWFFDTQH